MEAAFKQRIGFSGELEEISQKVSKDFELGDFVSNKLVLTGYEDFNFILGTTQGRYFVKVFANFRTLEDCKRYVEVMEKAIEAEVSMPNLLASDQGVFHQTKVDKCDLRLCVMEYIDGKDLFSMNYLPSQKEIRFLARQAALINSIKLKPDFVYDSWAIVNFPKEFKEKGEYLGKEDMQLVKPLIAELETLKVSTLPHCFVHGDIIATNVMKDKKGKLWIIDFAVSNYYPRIQELAVLACNLLFDAKSRKKSEHNLQIALEEYQENIKLTQQELDSLQTYIKLAHAMHVLRANYEKIDEKNTSRENDYWYRQGKAGLLQMRR